MQMFVQLLNYLQKSHFDNIWKRFQKTIFKLAIKMKWIERLQIYN